jgi:hypothetical protein
MSQQSWNTFFFYVRHFFVAHSGAEQIANLDKES